MQAKDFAVNREVGTCSWLGRRHQGAGIGTRMREAVLSLAFEGLGAEQARPRTPVDFVGLEPCLPGFGLEP